MGNAINKLNLMAEYRILYLRNGKETFFSSILGTFKKIVYMLCYEPSFKKLQHVIIDYIL